MDNQKIVSFALDLVGVDLEKLFDGLGLTENIERKNIRKNVDDFNSEMIKRHKDNPDFEKVLNFWKDNNIVEELLKLRYSLNSKFENYHQYKMHIEKKIKSEEVNGSFLINLMDDFEKMLSKIVQQESGISQALLATFAKQMELKKNSGVDYLLNVESKGSENSSDIFIQNWLIQDYGRIFEFRPKVEGSVLRNVKIFGIKSLRFDNLESDLNNLKRMYEDVKEEFESLEDPKIGELYDSLRKGGSVKSKPKYQYLLQLFNIFKFENVITNVSDILNSLFPEPRDLLQKDFVVSFARIGDVAEKKKFSTKETNHRYKIYFNECYKINYLLNALAIPLNQSFIVNYEIDGKIMYEYFWNHSVSGGNFESKILDCNNLKENEKSIIESLNMFDDHEFYQSEEYSAYALIKKIRDCIVDNYASSWYEFDN
ncbi:TPA: hypothetical protein U1364_002018 [Streptococcus suis]|nr:hypothetical protein [Streptococcus suis]